MDRHTLQRIATHLKYYLIQGGHPLTPLQEIVVEDVIRDIEAGNNGGYVKRPTGTGKTVIFSAILDALQSISLHRF